MNNLCLKLCLVKKLLNMLKLWCERGIRLSVVFVSNTSLVSSAGQLFSLLLRVLKTSL